MARAPCTRSVPAAPFVAALSASSNSASLACASRSASACGIDQTMPYEHSGCGRSNGSSASTSGARNHWRATPACATSDDHARRQRAVAVGMALEGDAQLVARRRGLALGDHRQARPSRRHRRWRPPARSGSPVSSTCSSSAASTIQASAGTVCCQAENASAPWASPAMRMS